MSVTFCVPGIDPDDEDQCSAGWMSVPKQKWEITIHLEIDLSVCEFSHQRG